MTIPRPPLKALCVTSLPPKVLISTFGPPSAQSTPEPLTNTGISVRPTNRPAMSLPSFDAPTSTTSGLCSAMRAANRGATIAATGPAAAPASTSAASTPPEYAAADAAAPEAPDPMKTVLASPPDFSASCRASVASSSDSLVGAPSAISPIAHTAAIR